MKALVLTDYGRLSVADVPDPQVAPDDVLVRVQACGICGSDVHGMDGSTGRRVPPIIMGHEASGIIETTGGSVTGWMTGDRVTFDSTIYCGDCEFCRAGRINLCRNRRVLGVSCTDYRQNGAFAEFVAVPQRILYRLPASLPFEFAACVEPVSIAVHAARRAGVEAGQSAVVVGAGMIGLLLIQVLRAFGCSRVIAVDVAPDKLEIAAALGATEACYARDCGGGFDVQHAFECVGTGPTVGLAMQSVRKGGTVTLIGNLAPTIEWPLQLAVTRELTIHGSCASAGEYPECLDLLASGAVNVAPMIAAVAPLEQGPQWFDRLYSKEAGLLKVILTP